MRLGVIDFSEKHANIGTLFWATVCVKQKILLRNCVESVNTTGKKRQLII